MRESLTQRTLKGAAWIGGASVARLALRVVSVAILARLLTPHEYGVVAGALIAMDFAAMIYTMGLAPTLIQRKELRPDHVATAFFSALFIAVLAAVGMWFSAPLIAELLQIPELTEILKVLAWLTPFGAFSVLCEALLARIMQIKKVALRPLFSFTISTFLVAIPMAWYGFGYWSLVAMQAVDIIVSAATLGFAARKLLVWPSFSRRAFSELWRLSLGFTVNQPFAYLAQNADRVIIGRVLGTATLGLYTRASFFAATAATLFGNIARLSLFPAMAKVQEDEARLRSALLKSFSVLALLVLPTSAFCVIFAPELVDLLLGAQVADGRRAIRDPVRDVVFLSCLAQLRHAFPGTWTPLLDNGCSNLPSGGTHSRYLVGSAPWTYSNLCSDWGRDGFDACDHAHHREACDRPSASTRRSGARPSPRDHGSSERPLSRRQGAPA